MTKPAPLIAAQVAPRAKASNYPAPFASRVGGRRKRALGDVFGLRNFGVNRTTRTMASRSSWGATEVGSSCTRTDPPISRKDGQLAPNASLSETPATGRLRFSREDSTWRTHLPCSA